MKVRYDELDSLRGIASMSVYFGHLTIIPKITFFSILTTLYFPLNMFFSGGGAVIFFFVLSGFVLFLPYSNGKQQSYSFFLIKRIFRIYIPYLIAMILTVAACLLLSTGGIKGLSHWFNLSWKFPITLNMLVDHLILIGNFNSNQFDDVIWTLIQEMRISIIFPFLAYIIIRFNWKVPFLLSLGLLFLSYLNNIFSWQTNVGFHTSIFYTFEYIPMFMVGGFCANNVNNLINFYNRLPALLKVLAGISAYLLINYHVFMTSVADFFRIYPLEQLLNEYSVVAGAVLIIIITLSSKGVQKFLVVKPLKFIGKISYSLYLFHLPIIFSLIYLFYNSIPYWLIVVIAFPLTLLFSNVSWNYIEKPSINYGKSLISKIKNASNKRLLSSKEISKM